MDPISQNNPTNNPRLDLLHSTGDNQQLSGAAGAYGPTAPGDTSTGGVAPPPPAPRPQPAVPRPQPQPSAAPQSASSYIGAAQARRPQASAQLPPPPPEPRAAASVPMYTSGVGAGSGDEGGGIGIGGVIVGVVILLLVLGGMYFMFSSQVNNQNKQIQSALNQFKSGSSNNSNSGGSLGDVTTSSIGNSGDLKTQTLEVTGASDPTQTSMTVNGSSEFQGPVKFDQDITTGGNITANGTITAASFVGDGSRLTGLPSGGGGSNGAAGPQGAPGATGATGAVGATGPAGAPNPDAVACSTCVTLQGASPGTADVGNVSITGTGVFGGNLIQKASVPTPTGVSAAAQAGSTGLAAGTYYIRVEAVNGSDVSAPSTEVTCTSVGNSSDDYCHVSWTGVDADTGYRVYVGTSGGAENQYFTLSGSGQNQFTIQSLTGTSGTPVVSAQSFTANTFSGITNYISGDLGIGTTNPTSPLDVVGTITATGLTATDINAEGSLQVSVSGTEVASINEFGITSLAGLTLGDGNGITFTNGGSITGAGSISGTSLQIASSASIASDGSIIGTSLNVGGGLVSGGTISAANGNFTVDGSANVNANTVNVTSDVNASEYCLEGCNSGGDPTGITLGDTSGYLTLSGGIDVGTAGIEVGGIAGHTGTGCTGSLSFQNGLFVGGGSCASGGDYAEKYNSTQSLSPGEVVAIDTANASSVVATTTANQATAIGIVSTQPGDTIGVSGNTIVAEAGHVPVDVTNENGPIAAGDYLTPSGTPGYAMKANPGDKTIAQAMADFSGTSGKVDAFIEISNGGAVTTTTPATDPTQTQSQTQPTQGDANGTFADLNSSGTTTLNNLTVTGTTTLASLTVTGTTTVADLVVDGHIVGNPDTRGSVTVPAGATTFTHAFTSAYAIKPTVVASPDTSAVSYFVTATTSGFTITLSAPAAADQTFSYLVQQ